VRNTLQSHTEQRPLIAGLPFFITVYSGSLICILVSHFTQ